MDSKIMDNQDDKIKLFDNDEEEDNSNNDFKIRPQFQGPHGLQMLEISSQLPKRFKLDERFLEDLEPESLEKEDDEITKEKNEEREKNIRILETVLGHEVIPKSFNKNKSKKRQIRFDPDDENASQFVKEPETSEKPKKPKKKKIVEEKVEPAVPISTERYIEVCSNLKEILNTSTPFSFSQKFNSNVEETFEDSHSTYEESSNTVEEIKIHDFQKKDESKMSIQCEKLSPKSIIPKSKADGFSFFISEGDARLKEGIEFFKRLKPLDEIREEWQIKREKVLEQFRRKKRSSQRSYSTRVQSMQLKNAIRKQNFKKSM